jgi:phosphoglucosamine mutase
MRVLSAAVAREFPQAKILSMDGIRADLPDRSWVLVRASGTEPILRITAESLKAKSSNKIAKDLTMLIKKTMEGLKRKL